MLSARPPIVGEELLGKPGVGVFGGRLSMFDDQKEKGAQARRTVGAQLADDGTNHQRRVMVRGPG
jgi:hypothetical protein